MANRGRKKNLQVKLCKIRPIKRIAKTFTYLIMKKNWIEKIAKLLSHSIEFVNFAVENSKPLLDIFSNISAYIICDLKRVGENFMVL